jgi:hypothetical protein
VVVTTSGLSTCVGLPFYYVLARHKQPHTPIPLGKKPRLRDVRAAVAGNAADAPVAGGRSVTQTLPEMQNAPCSQPCASLFSLGKLSCCCFIIWRRKLMAKHARDGLSSLDAPAHRLDFGVRGTHHTFGGRERRCRGQELAELV